MNALQKAIAMSGDGGKHETIRDRAKRLKAAETKYREEHHQPFRIFWPFETSTVAVPADRNALYTLNPCGEIPLGNAEYSLGCSTVRWDDIWLRGELGFGNVENIRVIPVLEPIEQQDDWADEFKLIEQQE